MGRPKGTPKTGGRQKGTPNKNTRILKEAVLKALDAEGGPEYLRWLARENSSAFSSLLGKILPTQVEGPGDEGEVVTRVVYEWLPPTWRRMCPSTSALRT